ncbi:MAG: M20/M25/M40 family metallo-hydrolase [Halodesulfurarchaeum sp.]
MDGDRRDFLDRLLETPSPSGYETPGQRVWVSYVSGYADEVSTDEYGNAVAVFDGGDGLEFGVGGHADEIGYTVSSITEEGFVRILPIGGSDPQVSQGTQIQIHTDDGPVNGVIGQTAIHLRDPSGADEETPDIAAQHVDIGAEDEEAARELVEIGDPATAAFGVHDLAGSRLAARGLDNRVGTWVAAETLRRAVERDVDATVYAISTVQEEVGLKGAAMVGYDLDPDALVAVDVTHASDNPAFPDDRANDIALGEGPVVARGTANHPALVTAVREAAAERGHPIQLQATGLRTGTDADAFYTQRGGIPSLNLGIPNRYMHTPAEVIDLDDLDGAATVLAETVSREAEREGFSVDL